jgi:type IV pilus assembly protein PilF
VFAGPGLPRGEVVAQRVGLVDVAPTLLDLLELPALPDPDGRSLLPLLRGAPTAAPDYELETLFPHYAFGWAPLRGLLRGPYKYVLAPRSELYRLSTDPDEKENLVAEQRERAARFDGDLRALIAGDKTWAQPGDPGLAEHRRVLESIGYVTAGGTEREGDPIEPKDGIAWIADLEAGRRAYQTGRPAEGIEPLRRLLSRNPRNVPALLALAVCFLGSGQVDRAVRAGRRALALEPDDDLVHFNLANALAAAGEGRPGALREAREHYERALELNPRFADAYLNYASLLERSGLGADSRALLERARSAGVCDPDLETRIAAFELKNGRPDAAEDALRRALALHPRAAGPLEALARITLRRGRYADAADYHERLLEVAPSAEVARTLGSIRQHRLGDREGARRAYERALALAAPDDPDREALRKLIDGLSPSENR